MSRLNIVGLSRKKINGGMGSINDVIKSFVKESRDKESLRIKSLINVFAEGRWLAFGIITFFVTIGLVRGLTSPNEYTTVSKVITEQANPFSTVGFGNLTMLAGINPRTAQQSEMLSPDLYPSIITNSDFILSLAQEKYYFEELADTVTLVDYFANFEKRNWISIALRWPRTLLSIFNTKSHAQRATMPDNYTVLNDTSNLYLKLTGDELGAVNKLQSRITVLRTDRIFEISTKMPEAKVSAILNKKIIDHLINYVIRYQTDRERRNKEFVEIQLKEAEKRYHTAQMNIASFKDNNIGLVFEADRTNSQRLQTEYDLASDIYKTLAQQLEQSKLRLEESKPVLSVFQQPVLPLNPSEPNVFIMTIVFGILGVFVSIAFIAFKITLEFFRQST